MSQSKIFDKGLQTIGQKPSFGKTPCMERRKYGKKEGNNGYLRPQSQIVKHKVNNYTEHDITVIFWMIFSL